MSLSRNLDPVTENNPQTFPLTVLCQTDILYAEPLPNTMQKEDHLNMDWRRMN